MNEIKKERKKSKERKRAFYNIEMLHKARNSVIKFFCYYFSMISEAKYKTIHGKGIKILTPKEVFQRLPIALAEVKSGDMSQNLLNEICLIIYYY